MINRKQFLPLLLLIFILGLVAACTPAAGDAADRADTVDAVGNEVENNADLDAGNESDADLDNDTNEATNENGDEDASEPEVDVEVSTEMTLYVAAETVECIGEAPQTCLLVRFAPEEAWTNFYDAIDGFTYEPGFEYELRVNQIQVADPPADGSSLRYELIEIVNQVAVEPAPAGPTEIVGPTWQWLGFEGGDGSVIEVENPEAYTLILLADGTYQIQADCNRGSGAYTLTDSSVVLAGGPMTLAECGPTSQYDVYVNRLAEVVTFVIADGKLYLNLMMDGGNLIFAAAPEPPLADNDWLLTSVISGTNRVDVNPELGISAAFQYGALNGFAGCNNYFGSFQTTEDSLSFGPIGSTRMFCEGEGSTLEFVFFSALEQVAAYRLDDTGLTLLAADGTVLLVFVQSS